MHFHNWFGRVPTCLFKAGFDGERIVQLGQFSRRLCTLQSTSSTESQALNPDFAEKLKALQPSAAFVSSLSPADAEKYKLVHEQVKIYAYMGNYIPKTIADQHWRTMLDAKSALERIRTLQYLVKKSYLEEQDMKNKLAAAEVALARRTMLEQDKKEFLSGKLVYGSPFYTEVSNPFRRNQRLRQFAGNNVYAAMRIQRPIFGFDMQYMNEWNGAESAAIGKMLNYAVVTNNSKAVAFDMRFFNFTRDGELAQKFIKTHLNFFLTEYPEQTILPGISKDGLKRNFADAKNIVYLARNAYDVLDGPLDADAYVICASFDTQKQSIGAARRLKNQVRIASLPIDRYVKWRSGSKKLPFNAIVNILAEVYETGGDWSAALHNNISRRHLLPPEKQTSSSIIFNTKGHLQKQKNLELAQMMECVTI